MRIEPRTKQERTWTDLAEAACSEGRLSGLFALGLWIPGEWGVQKVQNALHSEVTHPDAPLDIRERLRLRLRLVLDGARLGYGVPKGSYFEQKA